MYRGTFSWFENRNDWRLQTASTNCKIPKSIKVRYEYQFVPETLYALSRKRDFIKTAVQNEQINYETVQYISLQ